VAGVKLPNREDVLAAYAEGPEAVVTLVGELVAVIVALQEMVAVLTAQVEALRTRVETLEAQLAKDSHNSSKPPSSDGPGKKPTPSRQPSDRKPGGQKGHEGNALRFSEAPDRVEAVPSAETCQGCGASLGEVAAAGSERRQVFDLPVLRLEVVEYRGQTKECPCCGRRSSALFPPEAPAAVQYGPRIQALGIYLMGYQLLPYERTAELLGDIFGIAPSEGTLHTAAQECAAQLQPVEEEIKQGVQQAEVAHFDETGLRVKNKRGWLHVACTTALTFYAYHTRRGRAATDDIGILPGFEGRAIHDGLTSYPQYGCAHGLCNAHHLRELTFVEEQFHQDWAAQMKELLLDAKASVEQAKRLGLGVLSETEIADIERRYQTILDDGFAANAALEVAADAPKKRGRKKQSKAKNLLDRLDQHRSQVLAFVHHFQVPFDNNLAERDLRMVKVQQKISGCFRTVEGAKVFCRIRGYISTVRKQGGGVLAALDAAARGRPLHPAGGS
jgi:transposase